MHDAPAKELSWIPEMNLLVTGSWDKTLSLVILGTISLRYWDLRQPNPAHVQQLPECCYALTVKHPLMVAGTADRNLVVFNLLNPQVLLLMFDGIIQVIEQILATEFKRITSPLKYQTRCLAAFPDQQGCLVGSIEGRVGVHHLDDSQESKNFTFKCHREGNEIYSVNSLNFRLHMERLQLRDLMVPSTFGTKIANSGLRSVRLKASHELELVIESEVSSKASLLTILEKVRLDVLHSETFLGQRVVFAEKENMGRRDRGGGIRDRIGLLRPDHASELFPFAFAIHPLRSRRVILG
ncbi:hypothetical protein RND71_040252 [Anisodus tanguticus]|uniref:Uncharacterized protein n=1 Tax=Anisodus tanguticus TaxID=243964 RepID=A0AAE1QSI0_9SOLA|nr:hypothetical protein RND71_040252 [Anisodus tanguticus]